MVNTDELYKIVRFFSDSRPREDREGGLTLAEAQAHCQDEETSGDEWFDGYIEE